MAGVTFTGATGNDRFILRSMQVTNISNNVAYISSNVLYADGNTGYLGNLITVPQGGFVEFIGRTQIFQPNDSIYFRGFDNKIHRIYFKSQCFSIESPYFQKNESDTLLTLENINESTINVDNVKLIIYPNPAFNEVTLVAQEPLTNIYLFDLNGNLINEISNIKVNAIDFDISNYQSGFYFLMARFANGSYSTEKFIIN
jgi:hypothetical protein